ncbi:MAG: MFS transporter [Pseudomonadales bacterium]
MGPATGREKLAWSFYDFANSGYTTVVLTTIFNAYFVGGVAAGAGLGSGTATFLWTLAVALGNGIVLLTAPVIGAVADHRACKKQFLLISTTGCVLATALLGFADQDALAVATALLVLSVVAFGTGEYLIAAFLPEIAAEDEMGRMSGYGWGLGYFGGLLTLGLCLIWITWAQEHGLPATRFVPATLWITATIFAVAALPTFVILRERAVPGSAADHPGALIEGFSRVRDTLRHARGFQDLFRFLITLVIFQAGMSTVIVIAAIYAQEVLGFQSDELILIILVVNGTAAVGAFGMGHLQDRIGSARSLTLALAIWILAIVLVLLADSRTAIWLPANLIGLAMGATQSAARALIGRFTPISRTGEFFGLWGLAVHLATIIGPVTYGAISWMTAGNQRLALVSTLGFFIIGLLLLMTVDEQRGRAAALAANHRGN